MQTIRMNDGTIVPGHILPSPDDRIISVYLDNMSLADGFMLMSSPEKTIQMTTVYGDEDQATYTGYTEITAINTAFGNCNLTMRKVN